MKKEREKDGTGPGGGGEGDGLHEKEKGNEQGREATPSCELLTLTYPDYSSQYVVAYLCVCLSPYIGNNRRPRPTVQIVCVLSVQPEGGHLVRRIRKQTFQLSNMEQPLEIEHCAGLQGRGWGGLKRQAGISHIKESYLDFTLQVMNGKGGMREGAKAEQTESGRERRKDCRVRGQGTLLCPLVRTKVPVGIRLRT